MRVVPLDAGVQRFVRNGLTAAAVIAVLLGFGCARKPPVPMQAPRADVAITHFAGTALSGPRPVTGAVAATPAIVADVEWLALERIPSGQLDKLVPVGASARLVIATRDRQPVWPTSRLTADVRWASGDDAAEYIQALQNG